ncbi:MAG: LysR substrate-binding domain-containing protein [Eggerthellaceae bacterium]
MDTSKHAPALHRSSTRTRASKPLYGEAGLRGFGALQAGHLDALIVVGACRHPDMDCLNLGKVMLGVIMSYRHPLAQHQTVSLDDISRTRLHIGRLRPLQRFRCGVLS